MRLAEIEAQKKTLKARLSKQERANDTRRKVLLGGIVLHHLKARLDEKFSRRLEDFLRRILPRVLNRDVDKDLFADLLAGLRRRKSAPMLLPERPSERRCGTPMSEIDRDLLPSREEERLLRRTLGCAIPEFVAKFGADEAVKRAEAELRRARRARSRKLHAFWSAVLAQIDPGKNESSVRGDWTARSPVGPRRGVNPTKALRASATTASCRCPQPAPRVRSSPVRPLKRRRRMRHQQRSAGRKPARPQPCQCVRRVRFRLLSGGPRSSPTPSCRRAGTDTAQGARTLMDERQRHPAPTAEPRWAAHRRST